MAESMTFAFGCVDERMADMVTPDGFGYAEPMFNEPAMEPWMDGVLDEALMMAAPSSWDDFDALNTAVSQATATPNAFDSMLADCSLPEDGQASSSGDLTVSPDMLDISSNLAFPDSEMPSFLGTEVNSSFGTLDSTVNNSSNASSSSSSSFSAQTTPEPLAGDNCELVFEQVASAFKDLARARAAADPRPISRKQKQRDASIALYLERLRDTCNEAVAALNSGADSTAATIDNSAAWFNANHVSMSSQHSSSGASSFSTSSPSEGFTEFYSQPQSARSSVPSQSPTLDQSRPQSQQPSPPAPAPAPPSGGIELVMDLNMNTATSLPRKHRPRTETQRQRYLAVRNQGACEKHKKQHKRCTCIDKAIPLTSAATAATIASSSPQTGAGTGTGTDAAISILSNVKSRSSVRKASSLRRVPGARGARNALPPTPGEDNWPNIGHDGEFLIRNNRPGSAVKGEASMASMASSASYLLQQQGKLDHRHDNGHDIGSSHDKGVTRDRGASSERVSTLPTNTGNVGMSIVLQGVLDNNANVRSRPDDGCRPGCNRGVESFNAHRQHILTMHLVNRDQGRRAVNNTALLVFPDGTWQSTHDQLLTNSQSQGTNIDNIGGSRISRLSQISSYLHLRDNQDCFRDKQKHTNISNRSRRECSSMLPSTMSSAGASGENMRNICCTNASAQLWCATQLAVAAAMRNTQLPSSYSATQDKYSTGSTPSSLLQPSISTISSAYTGVRWYIQAYIGNSVRPQLKHATSRQREFALWCFIWLSMLVLSAIFKGALA
ncbi:hypothetical protein MGYG_05800 [Nannizzia gypsea CBS 118893]|uniref:Uncharacterized protein n=1 Tax=Arthroderma gypseum (strain ATCC MYA-4604 / CBS 118893) TaxID=535722 RepID=E4UXW8_ARTGP|nr:hypothetical protein MGYG_05800 [Nannizzia gypsea CBS 118893]EFR02800.1 hypothetical protein MGYG_05800 [Nannizzia gypsea CBS 118893]